MDLRHVLVFMNFQNRLKDTMFKLSARGMEVLHRDEGSFPCCVLPGPALRVV